MIEGKTKTVVPIRAARLTGKDDLTAGDGAKHDVLPGKSAISIRTTSNVFALLRTCGVPVAFYVQDSPISFVAPLVRMLPWEVVVRVEAHGSYLKRHDTVAKGKAFDTPVLEFFLKTKEKRWRDWNLPCDDPLAVFGEDTVRLYQPNIPFERDKPFLELRFEDVFEKPEDIERIPEMGRQAIRTFLILRRAWALLKHNLVDFKVEFGIEESDEDDVGTLLLADVIDNDSWRLVYNNEYEDKQVYRDGGDLDTVLLKYERVMKKTEMFLGSAGYMAIWAHQNAEAA